MLLQSISRNAFRSLVPKVEAVVCAQRASMSSLGGMKGKDVSLFSGKAYRSRAAEGKRN